MLYNLLMYLFLLLITVDIKSSFQIINNQTTRSSVEVQTDPDNSEIRSEGLLNILPKRAENLSNDELLILRNLLTNDNNLNSEDTNILSTANNLEFAVMAEQLNIRAQPVPLFHRNSQVLLISSLPLTLQNDRIIQNQANSNHAAVILEFVG